MLTNVDPVVKRRVGIGAAAILVLVVAAVAMRPRDTGPDPKIAAVGGPVAIQARPAAGAHTPERSVEDVLHAIDARARPKTREMLEPRHARLEPAERVAKRQDMRGEQWAQTEEKLTAYAADAQWDDETTTKVHAILERTSTTVDDQLAQVGAGEAEWTAARAALRDARDQQFDDLRALLGDDEFDAFVTGMDFNRYSDKPRGRRGHGRGAPGEGPPPEAPGREGVE